jgi:hypothetical protein
MAVYATPADLRTYGLPDGALSNPARLVVANALTNAFTLDVHGFELNRPIYFRADQGGGMPAPLAAEVEYYAIPLNEFSFRVALAPDGASVDLTTAGEYLLVWSPLPIAGALEWASLIIDQNLPAHAVPLQAPFHELIVATTAQLAIGKLLNGYEGKSLAAMVTEATALVAKWGKGVPLRGENRPGQDRATNRAVSVSAPYLDRRGWGRFGGPGGCL